MHHQDYELLAGVIRHVRGQQVYDDRTTDYFALALASALAGDNPQFDRATFLKAADAVDAELEL